MSSSSLLYINVLLLVLIHSSIQIASPTIVFTEVTKIFTELQENILKFIGNIGGKDNFQKRLTNDAIRNAEKRINDLEVVNLGKILKFIGNIEDKDDLHKRLTDDAIRNVERRIDDLEERKKRLSGYIIERPYDLQQEINYSANVLEEVNRCGVTLEQFFTDLRNLQSIIFDQKTDLVDINVYEFTVRKRFLNKIKKNIQNSARKHSVE
ncbi:hypothetical protein KSF78_0008477 [Schistosoma japonicum]|nr:hypothetical protein KSF78_0008477 [Schistosoma japonicum]